MFILLKNVVIINLETSGRYFLYLKRRKSAVIFKLLFSKMATVTIVLTILNTYFWFLQKRNSKNIRNKNSKNMIGLSIGNYKILEPLNGTEKFGVYKAVDMLLNRNVYIKVPAKEFMNQPDFVKNFRFEAATLARLVHPNIPTLHSLTAADARLFMITEFLDGETLDKILRQQGKLSSERAISIFTQILDCLEYAHTSGIAHGNLKTDSIFLTESDSVKILGFGTSENFRIDETDENILSELTPKDKSDAGNDIYAVGKMFFEVLTGENAASKNIIETERCLRTVNPAISEKLVETVTNIFRLQTYGKFQSAAELRRELLPIDLNITELAKDSASLINTEFLGRSGNNSAAVYSIDFSQDENKFVKNAFQGSRKKARDENKTSADVPFNWKLAKKNFWVAGAGVLAIFVLHFFFQVSFINTDIAQTNKELIQAEQVTEVESFDEIEPTAEAEPFDEIDPFVKQIAEKPAEPAAEYAAKAEIKSTKPEVVRKPTVASPTVQPRPKAPPPRTLRKKEPQETRAERLRRAERILTGA
ncbi:hypothetical protein BH20ACI1_BH20ACI1_21930 [soil metagenome]